MRRKLALLALAVTSMVAFAFMIPLGLLSANVARDSAITAARQEATGLSPVLATSDDVDTLETAVARTTAGAAHRMTIHLPDGTVVGHSPHETAAANSSAASTRAETVDIADGVLLVQPVALGDDETATVEVFVPDELLTHGVLRSWLLLAGVGLALIAGSVFLGDRLGSRIVRASSRLADASTRLGAGDLEVRVQESGPEELATVGKAFNTMAERIRGLLAAERELVGDLSHRLRTPLTALRLNAGNLGDSHAAAETREAVDQLEQAVDGIITEARGSLRHAGQQPSCDAAGVLRERVQFWSTLAQDQGRPWDLRATQHRVPVPVPSAELSAAIDVLIGNVFRHTPQPSGFTAALESGNGVVDMVISDDGPGFVETAPAESAADDGESHGSTGRGLDIARRLAHATGGDLTIHSGFRGTRVRLSLRQDSNAPAGADTTRPRRALRKA